MTTNINSSEHIINCNVKPSVLSKAYIIVEHKKSGKFKWDIAKIELWFSPNQRSYYHHKGWQVYEELKGKPVINANVLDYLLKHQHLIPEGWKEKRIFFWGTVYGYENSTCKALSVRYLRWDKDDKGWVSYCQEFTATFSFSAGWLCNEWNEDDPAILFC